MPIRDERRLNRTAPREAARGIGHSGYSVAHNMPVQPGNVATADPKEQLGRMFLRDGAEPSATPAPDTFLSK